MKKKILQIHSSPEEIHVAEQFCREVLDAIPISEDLKENILIVCTELVNNAIIHGNQKNPSKKVEVSLEYDPGEHRLICLVADEGKGFSDEHLGDPTAEENIFRTSGRGIFIVKHLVSSFEHYMSGNKHVVKTVFQW